MPDLPSESGPLLHQSTTYGSSENGIPLEVYSSGEGSAEILIMGSIHGDESLSTVLLSECMRALPVDNLAAHVVLSVNPDGVLAGTRCNARGVDLNRNFPTVNWSPNPVLYRNQLDGPRNIALSPGEAPGSEQETQALIKLIDELRPRLIVSVHGFLSCIDDPDGSPIALDLANRSAMQYVQEIGYATPGSLGSWCKEQHFPIITYELPVMNIQEMRVIHLPILQDLLTDHYLNMLV